MAAFIVCLCIATTVALPSGVYILDSTNNQFYNPLTQPHSQLDLDINFRGDNYEVAENACSQSKVCTAHRECWTIVKLKVMDNRNISLSSTLGDGRL